MGQPKLKICNQALIKIGEQTIISLDEDIDGARLCNLLFDQALEEVLREYTWGCATSRATLAQLGTPEFGYDYAYALPADYIRLVQMYDESGSWDPNNHWVIEGGKLLTDVSGVSLVYIKWIEDTLILDSLATSAMICKLATKMSFARTQSKAFTASLIEEYETVILPRARSIDTYEQRDKMEATLDPWLAARHGALGYRNINL